MSRPLNQSNSGAPVYGFLCQETNVFYAFETQEQYQEFLEWLQTSAQPQASPSDEAMISDEQLKYHFDRATENIMKVFEDPVFSSEESKMELEEIDF